MDSATLKNHISFEAEVPFKYSNPARCRSWVEYGTTNRPAYMNADLAGRVLPIDVFHLKDNEFHLNDEHAIDKARDGIWAAAVQEYFKNWQGKAITYEPELLAELVDMGRAASSDSHTWVELVEKLNADRIHFIHPEQLDTVLPNVDKNKLKGLLEAKGFVKKRFRRKAGGHQETLWGHHHRIISAGGAVQAEKLDTGIKKQQFTSRIPIDPDSDI